MILAVNVSAATMLRATFRARLSECPLDRMSFEVTEHQPVDDYDALADVTAHLREQGALLCVDDAGRRLRQPAPHPQAAPRTSSSSTSR